MIENQTILTMDGTVDGDKVKITAENKPFDGDSISDSIVVGEQYADLFIDLERAAKRLSEYLGVPIEDCHHCHENIMEDGSIPYDQLTETLRSRLHAEILIQMDLTESQREKIMEI